MNKRIPWRLFGIFAVTVLLTGCSAGLSSERAARRAGPMPQPAREFRGVWIASVANIDWPSQPGLSSAAQQAELEALLDRVAALNMNAVVLQVRPAADAFYASAYEPWSWYLTGEMGRPPAPYYDPLRFAVEAAHDRGLELHAWFNPFRAGHRTHEGNFSPDHITALRPDLVVRYGEQLWMDPGMPDAREHSLRVMLDVVRRYDIDGIHLDDYFYPYPIQDENNREVPFPDSLSWRLAGESGIQMAHTDWRRANINRFIEQLYTAVKQEKEWVKVGLSPFGIWRPGHPEGIVGFDAYDKLYADARLWLQRGWVDYMSPQLYWPIDSDGQSYPKLLSWWKRQNTMGRHIWPGNSIYRIDSHDWPVSEIIDQVEITRSGQPNPGNVFFSMRVLKKNVKSINTRLVRDVYGKPALIPAMPWLDQPAPREPLIALEQGAGTSTLSLQPGLNDEPWKWVIRVRVGSRWHLFVEPGEKRAFSMYQRFGKRSPDEIIVSYTNRLGQESATAEIRKEAENRMAIGF